MPFILGHIQPQIARHSCLGTKLCQFKFAIVEGATGRVEFFSGNISKRKVNSGFLLPL